MNLLNIIHTAVADFVIAFFQRVHVDAGVFSLARLDQYIDGSGTASGIASLLSKISIVLCMIFAGILLAAVVGKRALKNAASTSPAPVAEEGVPAATVPGALRGRWTEIVQHLDSPRENDWKQAVLEADKLVESALARAGFPGETFGDRLANIQPGMLVSLDGLGWAHGVRNRVAHEMDYFLRYTEAKAAMSYYEAALSELQLL